jgi:hypothetical protein
VGWLHVKVDQEVEVDELLLARRVIAATLAEVFADPGSRVTPGRQGSNRELGLAAWAVCLEAIEDIAESAVLAQGEVQPLTVSTEPLYDWLEMEPGLKDRVHERVFGLVISKACPLFETEYLTWSEPAYRAQQIADVAGFYNAFGVEPSPHQPHRHDHIALELEFMAYLWAKIAALQNEADQECREGLETTLQALKTFLHDHVVWWFPAFACSVEKRAGELARQPLTDAERWGVGVFVEAARFLRGWTAFERLTHGIDPPTRLVQPLVLEPQSEEEEGCGGGECGG